MGRREKSRWRSIVGILIGCLFLFLFAALLYKIVADYRSPQPSVTDEEEFEDAIQTEVDTTTLMLETTTTKFKFDRTTGQWQRVGEHQTASPSTSSPEITSPKSSTIRTSTKASSTSHVTSTTTEGWSRKSHHQHQQHQSTTSRRPNTSSKHPFESTTAPVQSSTWRIRASTQHRVRVKDPLDDLLPRQYFEDDTTPKPSTERSRRPTWPPSRQPDYKQSPHNWEQREQWRTLPPKWASRASTITTSTARTTTTSPSTTTRGHWHPWHHRGHHNIPSDENRHTPQTPHHEHRQPPHIQVHAHHHTVTPPPPIQSTTLQQRARGHNGHPTHERHPHWHGQHQTRPTTTTPTTTTTMLVTQTKTSQNDIDLGDPVEDVFTFESHTVPDESDEDDTFNPWPQRPPVWPPLKIPTSAPVEDDDEQLQKIDEFDEGELETRGPATTAFSIPTTTVRTTTTAPETTTPRRRGPPTTTPYAETYTGDITIVTALIDIGRGDWWQYRRPLEKYHEFMENLLSLRNNMVIFTDSKSYKWVVGYREKTGVLDITKVYSIRLEDVPLWRYHDYAKEIIEKEHNDTHRYRTIWDPQMMQHPEAKSAEYDILVNSKTHFLNNVTQENPFDTGFFVWIDAGYGHGNADIFPFDGVWRPSFPKGKISMIKLTPPHDQISNYKIDKLYRQNWSVVSGGFIAGDAHTIGQLHTLFHRKFVELVNREYVDDDQTTMVLVINANSHLFNIVHGDWFDAFRKFDPIFNRRLRKKRGLLRLR